MRSNAIGKVFALITLLAAYLTLSLPLYADLAACALLAALYRRLSAKQLYLTTASAIAGLLAIVPCVHVLSRAELVSAYYREHEMYSVPGHRSYRPNVVATVQQPFGDLCAIDPLAPVALREPRTVEFRTDSSGYRNAADYHQQLHVIAGDSFAVANGTTQSQTLQEQLQRKLGLDTYSIAFPGAPRDYMESAREFRALVPGRVLFSFLFYEGNDFENAPSSASPYARERSSNDQFPRINREVKFRLPSKLATLLDGYDALRMRLLRPLAGLLGYPNLLFGASRRLERSVLARSEASVTTFAIGGKLVGLLEADNRATLDPDPKLEADLEEEILRYTACVFFVPTKLRVYGSYLPRPLPDHLQGPAPAFDLLRRSFEPHGIPVVDLTPALQEAAKRALRSDQKAYVYWRDDTHWNGEGIAAAAPVVASCLRSRASLVDPRPGAR